MDSLQFHFIIPMLDKEKVHVADWDNAKDCYIIDDDNTLLYTKEEVNGSFTRGSWVLV